VPFFSIELMAACLVLLVVMGAVLYSRNMRFPEHLFATLSAGTASKASTAAIDDGRSTNQYTFRSIIHAAQAALRSTSLKRQKTHA